MSLVFLYDFLECLAAFVLAATGCGYGVSLGVTFVVYVLAQLVIVYLVAIFAFYQFAASLG